MVGQRLIHWSRGHNGFSEELAKQRWRWQCYAAALGHLLCSGHGGYGSGKEALLAKRSGVDGSVNGRRKCDPVYKAIRGA